MNVSSLSRPRIEMSSLNKREPRKLVAYPPLSQKAVVIVCENKKLFDPALRTDEVACFQFLVLMQTLTLSSGSSIKLEGTIEDVQPSRVNPKLYA